MKKSAHIPVSSPSVIETCIPYIRSSYENARDEARKSTVILFSFDKPWQFTVPVSSLQHAIRG
ncbi:MAG: hypothetical protein WCJ93_05085 [Methanomicrobiales archaeon]